MGETLLRITPQDHGRRMTLAEFEHAEAAEGHLYELSKGVVIVSGIPDPRHLKVVLAFQRQLFAYDATNPGIIQAIATGSDAKILVDGAQSERHPDLSVYKTPPPEDADVWRLWVPEIVIEVVSPSSAERDYDEKPEEYLRFGVTNYWIADADKGDAGEVLGLTRSGGGWKRRVYRPGDVLTTRVLPGLAVDVAALFAGLR